MHEKPSCAACGAPGLTPHMAVAGETGAAGLAPSTDSFGVALADIARCPNCGHMQLDPMPDGRLLSEAYAQVASDDYLEEEAGQRETARAALELIERYRGGRGALLDLGCWLGFLLSEAQRRGWDVLGVEPSEFASTHARERLGLNVITGELFAAPLGARRFDAVTMGDVIEHLPDPAAALRRVAELLRDDGVLWLALPDAGSRVARVLARRWWSVIPTHVQYFTRRSIRTLLERSGFEVLHIATAPKAFTMGYYLARTNGYAPLVGRTLVRAATAIGIAERIITPDFRDRMAVVARLAAR